jgi:hypothetical protein
MIDITTKETNLQLLKEFATSLNKLTIVEPIIFEFKESKDEFMDIINQLNIYITQLGKINDSNEIPMFFLKRFVNMVYLYYKYAYTEEETEEKPLTEFFSGVI